MAIKFTDLPQLSGTPSNDDVVAIVDVSEDVSKKITIADLVPSTFSGSVTADNYVEGVDSLNGTSVSIDPSNGSLAVHTLSGATTYSYAAGWVSGESITLHIESNNHAIAWPTTKWIGGAAPDTTSIAGTHIINLWKVGSSIYGAYVGEAVEV